MIGFERSFYVVYEGLEIEICVIELDKEIITTEDRQFTVSTSQLSTMYAATGKKSHNSQHMHMQTHSK